MKITPNLEWTDIEPRRLQAFVYMLAKMWRNLSQVVNGHIGFGDGTNADNIDGVWASTTTPVAPNTDFTITHNLGRVPVGYLVMQKDRAVDIYTGGTPPTTSQITLRATVASAVIKLFIFLLLFTTATQAQNVRVNDIAVYNANGFVKVAASALITVCTSVGTGTPCTPLASVCSSQSDIVCTSPNPFNADLNGNFGFWIVPGTYVVTITGASVVAKTITYTLGGTGGGGGNPGGTPTQLQYNFNSAILGGITGSSYNSGTGAVGFPGQLTAGTSGGVAGGILFPQGTLPSLVPNNWGIFGQTTVSGSGVNWLGPNKNGNAAGGVVFGSASSNTVTMSQSGDARHAQGQTGVTSTLTGQIICLAADCPAGEYEFDIHLNSTVSCGTPGPATLTPVITYTDNSGTKTNQAVPLVVNGGTTLATTMALGNTTNQAYSVPVHFNSTGAQNITFTLTYTACTVGTGTYSYAAQVVQKQ